MQLTYSLFTLGSMATMAAALSKADFVFPDTVPMHKRQTSGPAFECHSACGLAIQGAREDNYCENSEWLENLDGCLGCALEFNIWRYYGRLEDLAEPCGIDATPRPVGGASSSSAAPPAEATTSAAPPAEITTSAASESTTVEEVSSSTAESTTAEETSSSAAETTTAQESSSVSVPTTVISVVTSSSAAVTEEHSTTVVVSSTPSGVASASTHPITSTTPVSTPPVSEGAQVLRSGFVAAGVAIMLAINLM